MLPDNLDSVVNAARMAQKCRGILGDRSMTVNSFFRCEQHNKAVGGASNSQHKYGRALDVVTSGLSARSVADKLRPHLGTGKTIGGLGCYEDSGFVHIDNRPDGRGAYWEE
jgi:uncharacterized protein YcbK (DUF882 family)